MRFCIVRSAFACILVVGIIGHSRTSLAADSAVRALSELNALVSPTKETKARFFERAGPSFRRLAATELMARMLVGRSTWDTMTLEQRSELTLLNEKFVMSALHGMYDGSPPSTFSVIKSSNLRGLSGDMKLRCGLLEKAECAYHVTESTANGLAAKHTLLQTDAGWQLVDLTINGLSVHTENSKQVQELMRNGVPNLLQKMRERVTRY